MQTVTLKVQDGFMPSLFHFLEKFKDEVVVETEENIEYDPYFYDRQKELHSIRENIKNGKIQMIDNDTLWADIDNYVQTLQR